MVDKRLGVMLVDGHTDTLRNVKIELEFWILNSLFCATQIQGKLNSRNLSLIQVHKPFFLSFN